MIYFDSHSRRQNIRHQKLLQHFSKKKELFAVEDHEFSLVSLKAGAIINYIIIMT